ncbi:hypothetical protein J7643_08775 [bacterium]|nr:hypothetical protein [bacterium]
MAGISGVNNNLSVRTKTYAPAVQSVDVQAGGPKKAPAGDSFTSTVRIGTPLIKVGLDSGIGSNLLNGVKNFFSRFTGGLTGGIGGGAAGGVMNPGLGGFASGAEAAAGGVAASGLSGGVMGGTGGGVIGGGLSGGLNGIGNALKSGMNMWVGALKSNFLVSAVVSGVTNLIDVARGEITPSKAIATFAVDTAAYTGIGATSTVIGATLGSLIPIPFVGTALGIAAGIGFGYLYEKTIRKPFVNNVHKAIT